MSASPVIAVRQAIIARLGADSALLAALGGSRFFDETPHNIEPPYVMFAETQMRDWSAPLSRGAEQFPVIAVVSTMHGLSEALNVAQQIVDLLDEAPLILQGHLLIDLRFQTMETKREHNGRFARVNIRFRATTEYL